MPANAKFSIGISKPIRLRISAVTKPVIQPTKSEGAKIPPTPPALVVEAVAKI
jgi:hypothetical protein